jgi:hypothetical protein
VTDLADAALSLRWTNHSSDCINGGRTDFLSFNTEPAVIPRLIPGHLLALGRFFAHVPGFAMLLSLNGDFADIVNGVDAASLCIKRLIKLGS